MQPDSLPVIYISPSPCQISKTMVAGVSKTMGGEGGCYWHSKENKQQSSWFSNCLAEGKANIQEIKIIYLLKEAQSFNSFGTERAANLPTFLVDISAREFTVTSVQADMLRVGVFQIQDRLHSCHVEWFLENLSLVCFLECTYERQTRSHLKCAQNPSQHWMMAGQEFFHFIWSMYMNSKHWGETWGKVRARGSQASSIMAEASLTSKILLKHILRYVLTQETFQNGFTMHVWIWPYSFGVSFFFFALIYL